MKPRVWIGIVLAALVIVVGATAVSVIRTVLFEPAPEISSGDLSSFQASIDTQNQAMISDRKAALDLAGLELGTIDTAKPSFGVFDGKAGLDRAREQALGSLERISSTEAWSSEEISPTPEMIRTLSEADDLYGQMVVEQTSSAVDIYLASMDKQAPFYKKYIAWRTLANTVKVDLEAYRKLNAETFNTVKATLYQNESDTNKKEVDKLRAEADAAVQNGNSAISAQFGALLDDLIKVAATEWSSGVNRTFGYVERMAATASIREQIKGFSAGFFPPVPGPGLEPEPDIQRSGWIDREKDLLVMYASIAGVMVR